MMSPSYIKGDLCFGHVRGHPPWPATVTDISNNKYSLLFFGTFEVASLKTADLYPANSQNVESFVKTHGKKKGYLQAISELKEASKTLGAVRSNSKSISTSPRSLELDLTFETPKSALHQKDLADGEAAISQVVDSGSEYTPSQGSMRSLSSSSNESHEGLIYHTQTKSKQLLTKRGKTNDENTPVSSQAGERGNKEAANLKSLAEKYNDKYGFFYLTSHGHLTGLRRKAVVVKEAFGTENGHLILANNEKIVELNETLGFSIIDDVPDRNLLPKEMCVNPVNSQEPFNKIFMIKENSLTSLVSMPIPFDFNGRSFKQFLPADLLSSEDQELFEDGLVNPNDQIESLEETHRTAMKDISNLPPPKHNRIDARNANLSKDDFVNGQRPKNTVSANVNNWNDFVNFVKIGHPEVDIRKLDAEGLKNELAYYFQNVLKVDGEMYNASCYKTKYNAIKRHMAYLKIPPLSPAQDKEVDVVIGKRKKQSVEAGKIPGMNRAFPFTREQLAIILSNGLLGNANPIALRNTVFMNFNCKWGLRARVELKQAKMNDIIEGPIDENGLPQWLGLSLRLRKNMQGQAGYRGATDYDPKIFQDRENPDLCGIAAWKFYLTKKTPSTCTPDSPIFNNMIYRKNHDYSEADCWYSSQETGSNKLGDIYKEMASKSGIDAKLNHIKGSTGRKLTLNSLSNATSNPILIAKSTGQKSVNTQFHYTTPSEEQNKTSSNLLSAAIAGKMVPQFEDELKKVHAQTDVQIEKITNAPSGRKTSISLNPFVNKILKSAEDEDLQLTSEGGAENSFRENCQNDFKSLESKSKPKEKSRNESQEKSEYRKRSRSCERKRKSDRNETNSCSSKSKRKSQSYESSGGSRSGDQKRNRSRSRSRSRHNRSRSEDSNRKSRSEDRNRKSRSQSRNESISSSSKTKRKSQSYESSGGSRSSDHKRNSSHSSRRNQSRDISRSRSRSNRKNRSKDSSSLKSKRKSQSYVSSRGKRSGDHKRNRSRSSRRSQSCSSRSGDHKRNSSHSSRRNQSRDISRSRSRHNRSRSRHNRRNRSKDSSSLKSKRKSQSYVSSGGRRSGDHKRNRSRSSSRRNQSRSRSRSRHNRSRSRSYRKSSYRSNRKNRSQDSNRRSRSRGDRSRSRGDRSRSRGDRSRSHGDRRSYSDSRSGSRGDRRSRSRGRKRIRAHGYNKIKSRSHSRGRRRISPNYERLNYYGRKDISYSSFQSPTNWDQSVQQQNHHFLPNHPQYLQTTAYHHQSIRSHNPAVHQSPNFNLNHNLQGPSQEIQLRTEVTAERNPCLTYIID